LALEKGGGFGVGSSLSRKNEASIAGDDASANKIPLSGFISGPQSADEGPSLTKAGLTFFKAGLTFLKADPTLEKAEALFVK
jgi:hypothetical protein